MNRKFVYLSAVSLMMLVAAGAQAANWDKAVYWDARCRTGWANDAVSIDVRDACLAAGYTLLDADQLKTWMDGHIADQALSVVVLARDNVPNTVVETIDASCTLRKYLDAGGKIVFYADIPFWDIAHTDGTWDNPQTNAQNAILGIGTDLVWDTGNTVTITGAGAAWGLTSTWASARATPAGKVSEVLASDAGGNAAAWVKFFVPGDWYRGFIRLYDSSAGTPNIEDILRVAEYTGLKASSPSAANGAVDVTSPLFTWTPSKVAAASDVYFGTNPDPGQAEFKGRQGWAIYVAPELIPGATYYWRIDTVEADGVTVHAGDVWTFSVMPVKAYKLSPYNGALNRYPDVKLSWAAGNMAQTHNVYLGTDQAAVAAADTSVFKSNQEGTEFDPNGLALGTTYYWRVDEIDAFGATINGDVQSFSTMDAAEHGALHEVWSNIGGTAVSDLTNNKKFSGPADQVDIVPDFEQMPLDAGDNYGQRLRAWLNVPAAGEYTFWVASDDASKLYIGTDPFHVEQIAEVTGWTSSRAWDWEAGQKSAPVALDAGKYFLMALMKEGGGGDNLSAAWQGGPILQQELILGGFLEPFNPVYADNPSPANGAVNAPQRPTLAWAAGSKATAHDVFIGTDPNVVAAADITSVDNYVGQVTETSVVLPDLAWNTTYYWRVDEIGEGGPWKGGVWSFTTAKDVLMINEGQLTMDYDNGSEPFVSEFVFDTVADWTANGISDLVLQFQGNTANRINQTAVGTTTMTTTSGDVWGSWDNFRFMYKELTGDGSVTAKVYGVSRGGDWSKAGVMVRQSLDGAASQGMMVITPQARRAFQNRPVAGGASFSAHGGTDSITFPCWVKVERVGNQVTGFWSQDGATWTKQSETENTGGDASPNPQTCELGDTVYVGFMATSNNTAASVAEFSDLSTTGSVSADWKVDDVGGFIVGNDAAPVFVALEDSAGNMTMMSYPDGSKMGPWWTWKIPLSSFNAVDLKSVAKLHVGVGDLLTPAKDGGGRVLFRNIRAIKPVTLPPVISSVVRANGQSGTRTDGSPINGKYDANTAPVAMPAGGLKDGNFCFSDRNYPWSKVPAELAGAEYVLMFNSDKATSETDVTYTVTLSRAATVAVTADDRIPAEWTAIGSQQAAVDLVVAAFAAPGTFVDTGLNVCIHENATTDRPMSVYAAELPAGTYVFGIQNSNKNYYTIGAIGGPADVTAPGDNIVGIPNNGNWPGAEYPARVIDNSKDTKFLHFSGKTEQTGFCVEPFAGSTIVTGMTFTSANDAPERDPVKFELYGSNDGINGPWTLIAAGDVVDFAGATAWPRKTLGTTPITFDNVVPYTNYKVMFTALRDQAKAGMMQVAEVELLGLLAE